MKIGRSLQELAIEVAAQKDTKRDYVAATSNMRMTLVQAEGRAGILGGQKPQLTLGDTMQLGMLPLAHQQLGSHLGIPKPYYDRMMLETPELLARNVNTWLHHEPVAERMVRTLHGNARAILSDKYRRLDNIDFLEAALPPLQELDVEIMSCDVTDTRLYLKVVDRRINRDIPHGHKLGDGSHKFFDTVSPALVLSNSEVGLGALSVKTSIFTHLCTNLAVVSERSTRKYHIGTKADLGEDMYALLSDSTKALTDQAMWAQIGDVVRGAFNIALFDSVCEKLTEAAGDVIEREPFKVIDVTAKKFAMSESEKGSVLQHLIEGGDLSRYGLHAAVTRAAEDLVSYDRASQFEEIGGRIIDLNKSEWRELAMAA